MHNTKPISLRRLLLEYPDSKVNQILSKWGIDPKSQEANQARQLISRFGQIKGGLDQKLDIVTLPDNIKKGDYRNIDLYSYKDLLDLIRSYPENPDKIKKEAIARFEKEGTDRQTAQAYVARFMNKKSDLKHAVSNGTEDGNFSAKEVKDLIGPFLLHGDMYLDPRAYKWERFEQVLDALFPAYVAATDDENTASTNVDKVYDDGTIEIYKGDERDKCVSYNPNEGGMKKYAWCVAQPGNSNYDHYRFRDYSPTFYFVFDRSRTSQGSRNSFVDQWHAFVVQVSNDQTQYVITNARNDGDTTVNGWEEVAKVVPSETWAKIKNLKKYFQPIALTSAERGRKMSQGKNLTPNEFKELTQDEKIDYVNGKAGKNELTNDILTLLPKYKISYEGRSTTLANVAIDGGQEIPYKILKNYEPLAKRYAVYKFRHGEYKTKPIPLPYVKYLDDAAKEKYLEIYKDYLNFDYVLKFFGEKTAKKYANDLAKRFSILEPKAVQYIDDPKLKALYSYYGKLYNGWVQNEGFGMSDEELEDRKISPEQSVMPIPATAKVYLGIPQQYRDILEQLAIKNSKKYGDLSYTIPFLLEDGSKIYYLIPKSTDESLGVDTWYLIDKSTSKIVKTLKSEDIELDGFSLKEAYPNLELDDQSYIKRAFKLSDLKENGKPISLASSKELDEIEVSRLKHRANIR